MTTCLATPETCPLPSEGILLVNKPRDRTSFSLVSALRRKLKVKKIGHAGTLDPFATGVMVMLIGKNYTRLSSRLLTENKEYVTKVRLGISTDTYDCDGQQTFASDLIPSLIEVQNALVSFQGEIEQIPPMFSAKKINGQKLYDLARRGLSIERQPARVVLETTLISYEYPEITLKIKCSKGTYIRSIAHDLGEKLGCGAHLIMLQRTRSGHFDLNSCFDGSLLFSPHNNTEQIQRALLNLTCLS